ncbi:hypothetical protein F5Y19DRAFT_255738 [Xylariaceae sp. FL1651]|nr:hypothetical protein F5Y19DRAFT_255738 [Xylariaceae sp. FL1651]
MKESKIRRYSEIQNRLAVCTLCIWNTCRSHRLTASLVFNDGEHGRNAAAEDSALTNQLGNFTINAVNKAAESWICHCRMNSLADYYNVARLSAISLAKLKEGLRSEWCVESFCALLLECLNEIGDRDTLCLLGNIAAEHYDELAAFRLFEAGGPNERLAPFVLPGCINKLVETDALRKEAESRCVDLKYRIDEKESELTLKESESMQHLKNLRECKSLIKNCKFCRNAKCEAQFECVFETKGPYDSPTYLLRCTRCSFYHESSVK